MHLDGLHHISAITGDARANLAFYTGVLGLRLTAKTVNQDDPGVYHLFYGDEHARPGADLTFFEYPHAAPGRPGAGMVHTIVSRVGSDAALDFWAARLGVERGERSVRFADPEGLQHELVVSTGPDAPLVAVHPEVPEELALQGFEGVRAFSAHPTGSGAVLEQLMGAAPRDDLGGEQAWELRDPRPAAAGARERRGGWIAFDEAPAEPGRPAAGTVHHIAWGTTDADLPRWIDAVNAARIPNSGWVDRHYFHSLYFREPGGVLYELATDEPGFLVDGLTLEELGTRIILPPFLEERRADAEAKLTPLPDPRADWPAGA